MKWKHFGFAAIAAAILVGTPAQSASAATVMSVTRPSDDRWHYPFNFTPGTRTEASLFTSAPDDPFDYRDAMMYLRFRTGTLAPAGRPLDDYDFTAARVLIYHKTGTFKWDTRDGDDGTTDSAGNPFRFELFPMALDAGFTAYGLRGWTEFSPFTGQSAGAVTPNGQRRNPHPLDKNESAPDRNASDNPAATPWATGAPVYGAAAGQYLPNTAVASPFAITFSLDTNDPQIRAMLKKGLQDGFINLVISATADSADTAYFPRLFTKETLGAHPNHTIEFEGLPFLPNAAQKWNAYE